MGLTTSPVCAPFQLEEATALHFVSVCPNFAKLRTCNFGKPIMNALKFTEASALAILRFAFQSGRLETNLSHNFLKCVSMKINTVQLVQRIFFFQKFQI
jgi:hypothetical protein